MPSPRVVGVAVRYQRFFNGMAGVDPHIGGADIDAVRMRFDPVLGGGAGDMGVLLLLEIWGRTGSV